jgi:hypothetical protein
MQSACKPPCTPDFDEALPEHNWMKYELRIPVKDCRHSKDLKVHGMHARTGLATCARSRLGGPCRVHLLVQKKSDPLPGRVSQPGGCFLAVVVLQFTARCSQGSSIEKRSQLGKTLELNSAGGIGCRLGALRSPSAKEKRKKRKEQREREGLRRGQWGYE